MTSENYITALQKQAESGIATECGIHGIPYDAKNPATDAAILKSLSAGYASGLFDALFLEAVPPAVSYPQDAFFEKISHDAASLPENDRHSLAGIFGERTDAALNSFNQENLTGKPADLLSRGFIAGRSLPETAVMLIFPSAALSLLLAVLLLKGRKTSFSRRFYGVSGVIWCASALLFIPCMLLRFYNLPERLALADSPLKNFITAFLSSLTDRLSLLSALIFAAATVLLVLSAFMLSANGANGQ